jgi:hypothetical protein
LFIDESCKSSDFSDIELPLLDDLLLVLVDLEFFTTVNPPDKQIKIPSLCNGTFISGDRLIT